MEQGIAREEDVTTTRGLRGRWKRRTPLEKVLLGVTGLAAVAFIVMMSLVVALSLGSVSSSVSGMIMLTRMLSSASYSKGIETITVGEKDHGAQRQFGDIIREDRLLEKESSRWHRHTGSSEGDIEVCGTKECTLAAAELLEVMDKTTDPCDNFYQFACGGWEDKNPVSEYSSKWGQVVHKQGNAVRVILEEPESVDDPTPLKKVKVLFAGCMDMDELETAGISPLTEFLIADGGWPMASESWNDKNFDWQVTVANARKVLGSEYLIGVYVSEDIKNTNQTAIYIDQTSLGLERFVHMTPSNYKERVAAYKGYMVEMAGLVATSLSQTVSSESILADVEAVYEFERHLANLTTSEEDRRIQERMYNPMSVDEVSSLTEGSSIDWQQLLNNMFEMSGILITNSTRVIVKEKEYLTKTAALVDAMDSRTLSNYLMWRHVKDLGHELNEAMREASFKYSKVATGVSSREPRWKECAEQANKLLGMALGIKYIETYFHDQDKLEIEKMVEDIRSTFNDLLTINEWMDEETKPKVKEKANAIKKFIGYPSWYGNTSALEHLYDGLGEVKANTHFENILTIRSWQSTEELNSRAHPTEHRKWFSPATVNAFYNPVLNSIFFPAGYLQPPAYRANSLQALNYGAVGQVIGHEITHGFDDQGRLYDKDGNIIPWWTDATVNAFKTKAQCIVDQYNIRVPEIDELRPNATLNGVKTQGENIADNGSIRQAFLAYKKYIARNGAEKRLPGLEQYSPEHLFFLSNANTYCGTVTKEQLYNQILFDTHSPNKFRVLEPMKNMAEFATTWGCPLGSRMNPLKKCVVW